MGNRSVVKKPIKERISSSAKLGNTHDNRIDFSNKITKNAVSRYGFLPAVKSPYEKMVPRLPFKKLNDLLESDAILKMVINVQDTWEPYR